MNRCPYTYKSHLQSHVVLPTEQETCHTVRFHRHYLLQKCGLPEWGFVRVPSEPPSPNSDDILHVIEDVSNAQKKSKATQRTNIPTTVRMIVDGGTLCGKSDTQSHLDKALPPTPARKSLELGDRQDPFKTPAPDKTVGHEKGIDCLESPKNAIKAIPSLPAKRDGGQHDGSNMFGGRGIAKLIMLQAQKKATTRPAVPKPRATRTSVLRERSNKLRLSSNHAFRQAGTPSPILRRSNPSRDSQNITSNGFRRSKTRILSTGDLSSSTMLAAVDENQPPTMAKDADSDSALLLDFSLNDCQPGVLMPTEKKVSASAGQVSPTTTEQFNTSNRHRVSQYCEKYGYVISESIDARLVIMGEDEISQTRKKPTIQDSNQNPKPRKEDPKEPGLQLKSPRAMNKYKGDKTSAIINALDVRQDMRRELIVRKKPKTILPKQPPSIETNSKKQGMGKTPRASSLFKRPPASAPEKANNVAESLPLNGTTVENVCENQPLNSDTPRDSDGTHTSFHTMLNNPTAPISLVSLSTTSADLPHNSGGLGNKSSFGTVHQHRSRAFGSFGNVGQGIKDFGKKVGKPVAGVTR